MDKVTVLPPPLNGVDCYFVASDWHSFHLNPSCLSILLQHAMHHEDKKRSLIILGDFLDFEFLMKKKDSYKKYIGRSDGIDSHFLPLYQEEIQVGNLILDVLQKVFKEIIFVMGNHDKPRVDGFLIDCPLGYQHNFNMVRDLKFLERGIKIVVEYNNWLDIGNISLTHGMFHGVSALKKHYLASRARSVIFGHIHHDNEECFMVRGYTTKVFSLPAMCDLNPDYIRNSETNWTNGYRTLYVKPSGDFNCYSHTIWNDELVIDGGVILKHKNLGICKKLFQQLEESKGVPVSDNLTPL